MGITPDKYIKDLSGSIKRKWEEHDSKPMNGWLAISPLIVFICIYVVSSLIANDFYKIPISSAFMIASIYRSILRRSRQQEHTADDMDICSGRSIRIHSQGHGSH